MIEVPATGRERVAAGVLVGAAVLFVGFAIRRVHIAGFFGALTLPLVLLAADLVIAAAVLTWWYPLRPVAQGLAVFGILVHALVMLRSGPVWTRGCSGVLLLAHSWALVQLFLMTAAEDFDDEELEDPAPEGPPAEPAEVVETPVTEVVDVAVPDDADDPATDDAAQDDPAPDELGPDEAPVPSSSPEPDSPEPGKPEPEHDSEERIR